MPTFLPRRALTVLLCGLSLASGVARAQSPWKPDRPVTFIVPSPAGGGTDVQARAVAQELSRMWGQPVLIDNVPGVDGLLGTRKAIAAKPDGYTYLVHINTVTLAKHLPGSNGFDPVPELVPVSAYSQLSPVFAVHPSVPGKTLAEVISNCRTAATPCSFGTTETSARLLAQMLKAEAGLKDMVVVNYKGGSQLITDLVAGNLGMAVLGPTAMLPYYKNGGVKVLATMGAQRASMMPDVPSVVEAGFPYLQASSWYGLFAPKGTPQPTVDNVAAAVGQAARSELAQRVFANSGAQTLSTTPAEFNALVQRDSQRMNELVKRFPIGE